MRKKRRKPAGQIKGNPPKAAPAANGVQGKSETVPKAERVALIEQLEKERGNTYLISYVTSTRQGLEVEMAMDAVRLIYEHLELIDKPKDNVEIDLFIHSNGGDGTVPWRLVTLIREYAKKFSVLVPYKAFSAATLTALGAHEIVMHRMGTLGPTDPTVTNPFNPTNPSNPDERIGISVEDVSAYLALIKEDADIQHEDQVVEAFKILADKVHPLALGNVKRSLQQSRMMARKLLQLHMDKNTEEHKINEIVEGLTSKLFYHGHPINRDEAKNQLGLQTVKQPTEKVEKLMWQLYADYEAEIKMDQTFQAALEFSSQFSGNLGKNGHLLPAATVNLAYVESAKRTDVWTGEYQLFGRPHDPTGGVQVSQLWRRQGWQTV